MKTGQGDHTSPERCWKMRNSIRYRGRSVIKDGRLLLNWLGRVLTKSGFYMEVHKWGQKKVQEPDQRLAKPSICHPKYDDFRICTVLMSNHYMVSSISNIYFQKPWTHLSVGLKRRNYFFHNYEPMEDPSKVFLKSETIKRLMDLKP